MEGWNVANPEPNDIGLSSVHFIASHCPLKNIFLKLHFIYVCVCVFCLYEFLCTMCLPCAYGGQKRALELGGGDARL